MSTAPTDHMEPVQAYRLGTKLGLDEAVLGPREVEETLEELTSLHEDWWGYLSGLVDTLDNICSGSLVRRRMQGGGQA